MLFVQGKNHLRRRVGFLCVAQEKKKRLVMDLLKKSQVLKTGPLESDENWHAALKWEVMTKCRSGRKNSVERFSRYSNFCGCWGAFKWVFGHFVKYLFSYPYDLAEILHAALKWEVMMKCRSG